MASFVNEILATAGELQKEEVTNHLGKLSSRISQLKVDVSEVLTSKYDNFKPTLTAATELNSQVSTLSQEMKTVTDKIETEVRNKLNASTTEFSDLHTQLAETNGIVILVERLVTIHDALQACQSALGQQQFPRAAEQLDLVKENLQMLAKAPRSGEMQIYKALHTEYRVQSERLIYDISEAWNERVEWLVGSGKTNTQLKIKADNTDVLVNILEGMEKVGTLDEKLKKFGEKLLEVFIKPVITASAKVTAAGSTIKVVVKNQEVASPSDAFSHLDVLFSSLNKSLLGIELKQAGTTAMGRLGAVVSGSILEEIIKDCLAPSVPTSHSELSDYYDVISVTERFNDVLVKLKFISPDNSQLSDYVKNINVLFANKKCHEIMERARAFMKSEIHDTMQIGDEVGTESGIEAGDSGEGQRKPLVPGVKTTSMVSFKLPRCRISCSTKTLVDMAYETLTEATVSPPQCAVQLFYCVRNLFELYCCVVPTYHKDSLATLPQLTALHHNNCMFIAHHLMTMGHQFAPKLKSALMQPAPTFVDLVPKFRRLGTEIFLQQMQSQKKTLLEFLKPANGFDMVSKDDNYSKCEKCLKQVLHQLLHLSKIWKDVLPVNIYRKSIGTLLSSVLQNVASSIIHLDDISADDATQLHALLTMLHDRAPELVTSVETTGSNNTQESPLVLLHSSVPNWVKFTEIMVVLNANLQDICDRWSDGKGPLAQECSPNEVKQLIRALFQNTDRRAAVLAKIK